MTAADEVRARFEALDAAGEAAMRATDEAARAGSSDGPEYVAMCRAAFEFGRALEAARQLASALAESVDSGRRWVA
jgi:hypothetical protein